ncbi:hypothetical protein [Streptomyces sp. NPDC058953]|uniref:hypothetical protein n=1 Tax=Streptomyces sp. NPDC058953 TaxID=3346676 RepID=UPI0036A4FAB9
MRRAWDRLGPVEPQPIPAPTRAVAVDPWTRPWTGPTKEDAREIFRREAEERRGRRKVLVVVPDGMWLPCLYEGLRR